MHILYGGLRYDNEHFVSNINQRIQEGFVF